MQRSAPRTAIGIDPGSIRTGWGIVRREGSRLTRIASGVIEAEGASFAARLEHIFRDLQGVLATHRPTEAAIEGIFHHRNADSALKLGHARGVALLALQMAGLDANEYQPMVVKRAVTGKGRATKAQVAELVRLLLGTPPIGGADESDALAIAVCHLHHAPGAFGAELAGARGGERSPGLRRKA